jgi:hypothetical protein
MKGTFDNGDVFDNRDPFDNGNPFPLLDVSFIITCIPIIKSSPL